MATLYRFGVQSTRPENAGTELAGLLSPKLGVVLAPSDGLELYGNFGYGYHSNDGRGTTISVDPLTGARVDTVTPLVRTRGGEFGLRTILIPKLQTTVAVWGLSLDSELVFVGDAGTTEPGRPSRRVGVEWANSYTPRPWLLFDADLSWSSARFTDDDSSGSAFPGRYGMLRPLARRSATTIESLPGFASAILAPVRSSRTRRWHRNVRSWGTWRSPTEWLPRVRLLVDLLNVFDSEDSDIEYLLPVPADR